MLYASRILVQANQSTERVPATVEAIAPGIDLAILKLSDEALFDYPPAAAVGRGPAQVKNTVNAYGFPIGGEQLSVTEGIISRVEYVPYADTEVGMRIQVDAALNPGNSGGPAIANGKIVGLVFSIIANADNIGYLIPVDEIRMFLNDVQDGKYEGKPKLLDTVQTVENKALRDKLGLAATHRRPDDHASRSRPTNPIRSRNGMSSRISATNRSTVRETSRWVMRCGCHSGI